MAKRDRWNSRSAFILAAIGSAIGLGNVWRFPYIAYENGGGAFLIPYFIALLTAGIPIMMLEFSLGQRLQGSPPLAFKKLNKKWEWFGWWTVFISAGIAVYYCAIMAWAWWYLFAGFSKNLWTSTTNWSEVFYVKCLNLATTENAGQNFLTTFNIEWNLLLGLFLTWVMIYFIIYKGVRNVGKIVLITVPLPWLILVILFIRGITLEGAQTGIAYFLNPNWSLLANPKVWLAAYGQIFFSLSVGFGVMIAYASFMPKKSDITNNAFITALANCGTSFLAGFAVFSTLGYMAMSLNKPVQEVVASGPGLAFVTYPQAISLLPAGAAVIGALFFIMLLSLGIDSAFSLVEAFVASMVDKWRMRKEVAAFWFCLIGFIIGILFVTRSGLYWLDVVDHWINSFGIAVIGILECVMIGWVFNIRGFQKYINKVSEIAAGEWWIIFIKYVTPIILGITLVLSFLGEIKTPYGLSDGYTTWFRFAGGWFVVVLVVVLGIIFQAIKGHDAIEESLDKILDDEQEVE